MEIVYFCFAKKLKPNQAFWNLPDIGGNANVTKGN